MTTPRDPLHWKERPLPELLRLAWPIGVSMLSYSVMTLVDTLFVGRLGATALAGVSLGGITAFTLICFGLGSLRAVKVLVSQADGAGRGRGIPATVGAGMISAVAIGVLVMLIAWPLSTQLHHITATVGAAEQAGAYLRVRLLGSVMVLAAACLREARYGTGDSRTPMVAALMANGVNIALDALLIGVLNQGVRGAAWATVAAVSVELVWLLRARGGPGWRMDRAAVQALPRLWRVGLPTGLQMMLEVGAFAMLTAVLASLSDVDVAAHQIALQLVHFSFLPAFAIGDAASVMVGQAVGAERHDLIRPLAWRALGLAMAYCGACGAVFALGARPLALAFSDDVALVALTVKLLYVAAVFQLLDAANIVARCVLRGAGDVRFTAVVGVITAWICTPLFAIGLGYGLGLGALGGWIGFCAELVVAGLILWRRFLRGGWHTAAAQTRALAIA